MILNLTTEQADIVFKATGMLSLSATQDSPVIPGHSNFDLVETYMAIATQIFMQQVQTISFHPGGSR